MASPLHYKDKVLDTLAADYNVAQFVSFGPDGKQRYSRVANHIDNHHFGNVPDAVITLMSSSCGQSLNIRSFDPADPQSKPFFYGMDFTEDVVETALELIGKGLHVIIHETVDVNDGGVSGVIQGGVMEFAPGVTPRAVEGMELPTFPLGLGKSLLRTVYGALPELEDFSEDERVEFSVHPRPVGFKMGHVIIWELQSTPATPQLQTNVYWPNPFSKMLGDKAFGLLMADIYGYKVPATIVHMRKNPLKVFAFGAPIKVNNEDVWTRTCPSCQTPGRFTTVHGYVDPKALMDEDDPAGILIPSCLVQDGVPAKWSGATITGADGIVIIQGKEGFGDDYMQGYGKDHIPAEIMSKVIDLYEELQSDFGATGFEWVYDGNQVWIVQLHIGATKSRGSVIVPSEPDEVKEWVDFHPSDGLPRLQEIIAIVLGMEEQGGVRITGPVGMTSHVCDVLRKANVPSEIRC